MANRVPITQSRRNTPILVIVAVFFSGTLLSSSIVSNIVATPGAIQTVFASTESASLTEDSGSAETNENNSPPTSETGDNNSPPTSSDGNADTIRKNNPPEAGGGTVVVQSGGTVEINLAASDPDPDEKFTFHIQDQPNSGRLGEFDGNVIPYISNEGFVGTDSFTFTVRDGEAESNEAEIKIEVKAPPNRAPTAAGGTVEAESGQPIVTTMAASDPDAGEVFTFSIKDNPDFGKLTGLEGNVVTYTSNEGFAGTDVFTFAVSDGEEESSEAEVVIKVNAPPSSVTALGTTNPTTEQTAIDGTTPQVEELQLEQEQLEEETSSQEESQPLNADPDAAEPKVTQRATISSEAETGQRSLQAASDLPCDANYCLTEGQTLTITYTCLSQPDPRPQVKCVMISGPPGAKFESAGEGNPTTGTFTWTNAGPPGKYEVITQTQHTFCPEDLEFCEDSERITTTIRVHPVTNQPPNPVATVLPSNVVPPRSSVTLDGSGSSDPEGDPITYEWKQDAADTGIKKVSLSNAITKTGDPNAGKASFTAPRVTTETELTFHLTVSDISGGSRATVVKVTVRPTVGDFSVSCNELLPNIKLTAGPTTVQTACFVQSKKEFNSPVDLTCVAPPRSMLTCSLDPKSVTPPANGRIMSTLTVSGNPVSGVQDKFRLTVTGTSGEKNDPVSVTCIVECGPREVAAVKKKFQDMASFARSLGHRVAADNLEHYIAGSGNTKVMDVSWLRSYAAVTAAEETNQERFERYIRGVVHDYIVKDTLKNGQTAFVGDHFVRDFNAAFGTDLYYASGKSKLISTGIFVISRSVNTFTITGTVDHHWTDPYNWNRGQFALVPYPPFVIRDSEVAVLEDCDRAASFDMEADWRQNINGKIEAPGPIKPRVSFSWTGP